MKIKTFKPISMLPLEGKNFLQSVLEKSFKNDGRTRYSYSEFLPRQLWSIRPHVGDWMTKKMVEMLVDYSSRPARWKYGQNARGAALVKSRIRGIF